jgi:hypothetical protein
MPTSPWAQGPTPGLVIVAPEAEWRPDDHPKEPVLSGYASWPPPLATLKKNQESALSGEPQGRLALETHKLMAPGEGRFSVPASLKQPVACGMIQRF